MPDSKHYELTVTVISTDLSTSVTEAVRRAGYHGDTFVEAREVGTDEEKKFFGLTLSQKKAILLILTPASGKQPILKAICRTVLQEAGGHVIASSMSIDEMQGISG